MLDLLFLLILRRMEIKQEYQEHENVAGETTQATPAKGGLDLTP